MGFLKCLTCGSTSTITPTNLNPFHATGLFYILRIHQSLRLINLFKNNAIVDYVFRFIVSSYKYYFLLFVTCELCYKNVRNGNSHRKIAMPRLYGLKKELHVSCLKVPCDDSSIL